MQVLDEKVGRRTTLLGFLRLFQTCLVLVVCLAVPLSQTFGTFNRGPAVHCEDAPEEPTDDDNEVEMNVSAVGSTSRWVLHLAGQPFGGTLGSHRKPAGGREIGLAWSESLPGGLPPTFMPPLRC